MFGLCSVDGLYTRWCFGSDVSFVRRVCCLCLLHFVHYCWSVCFVVLDILWYWMWCLIESIESYFRAPPKNFHLESVSWAPPPFGQKPFELLLGQNRGPMRLKYGITSRFKIVSWAPPPPGRVAGDRQKWPSKGGGGGSGHPLTVWRALQLTLKWFLSAEAISWKKGALS